MDVSRETIVHGLVLLFLYLSLFRGRAAPVTGENRGRRKWLTDKSFRAHGGALFRRFAKIACICLLEQENGRASRRAPS
jgi:hypothetical protein